MRDKRMFLTLSILHILIQNNGATVHTSKEEKGSLRIDESVRLIGLRGGVSPSRQVLTKTESPELISLVQQMRHKELRESQYKIDRCKNRKLLWWVKIRKKCRAAFGEASHWDKAAMDGRCQKAWHRCQSSYYTSCCTQTTGPKTMDAYCDKLDADQSDGEKKNTTDKACKVEGLMKGVSRQLKKITILVRKIDLADASNATSEENKALPQSPAPAPFGESDDEDEDEEEPSDGTSNSESKVSQVSQDSDRESNKAARTLRMTPLVASSPADSRMMYGAFAPAPVYVIAASPSASPLAPTAVPVATRCKQLTDLTKNVAKRIGLIKKWAVGDGMGDLSDEKKHVEQIAKTTGKMAKATEDAEASDPDLAFSLKSVLKLGKKLDAMLEKNSFCTKVDDDDDDDDEDKEASNSADEDDEEKDDEDEEDSQDTEEKDKKDKTKHRIVQHSVEPNVSAILELLEFDNELQLAVDDFETQVHPHGIKWWRYRYEYTIVESFVLAYAVFILYVIKWFVFELSFFDVQRFYRTGRMEKLYGYAYVYFIFQAACVWIMVLTAYVLYMPWGENNVFNICAKALHQWIGDTFRVPYLGSSWLFLILDVQFQLFATYCLYAAFVCMVAKTYIGALQDWKDIDSGLPAKSAANEELYERFHQIVLMRVQNSRERSDSDLKKFFKKRKLRFEGVKELEEAERKESSQSSLRAACDEESAAYREDKWFDFKLHLYLTEGLGRSMEYLVQVSLVTNLWLASCAIVVAIFAHLYQLAFMYLLPPFVMIGIITLVSGYFLSRHYIGLSEDPDHDLESKNVTVHNYCRAVQVILYCMFYSFARLLLSTDIFEHYPSVYFSALIVLLLVLLTLAAFGGQVMKETTCALILPPHISSSQFASNLDAIARWHTRPNCHQCGVGQRSQDESFSIGWAGDRSRELRLSARSARSLHERTFSFPH